MYIRKKIDLQLFLKTNFIERSINRTVFPYPRRTTYVRAVCNTRPLKTETRRTRLTAGVNLINYPGEVSTPTSDFTTMKIRVNSAILDIKSRYMCMDIKYFYLDNQMCRAEYIMKQISVIPQEFLD